MNIYIYENVKIQREPGLTTTKLYNYEPRCTRKKLVQSSRKTMPMKQAPAKARLATTGHTLSTCYGFGFVQKGGIPQNYTLNVEAMTNHILIKQIHMFG